MKKQNDEKKKVVNVHAVVISSVEKGDMGPHIVVSPTYDQGNFHYKSEIRIPVTKCQEAGVLKINTRVMVFEVFKKKRFLTANTVRLPNKKEHEIHSPHDLNLFKE